MKDLKAEMQTRNSLNVISETKPDKKPTKMPALVSFHARTLSRHVSNLNQSEELEWRTIRAGSVAPHAGAIALRELQN